MVFRIAYQMNHLWEFGESDHKDRLTRNNVIEILKDTKEILGWKLYYPAPDEKLPQAIYTDEYLPMKSIRDRVIPLLCG